MKNLPIIFSLMFICAGCNNSHQKRSVEYVKIYNLWNTDSVSEYNKGLGVYWFLLHDFETDSAVFRFPISNEPVNFKTYLGKLENRFYTDTILRAIKFLKNFPEGELPTKDTTSNYCGPVLNMEFKDADGVHFYSFILQGDRPLEELADFFFRLNELEWKKKPVNNSIVNSDKEAVNASIKLGEYYKIFPPYAPKNCGAGIDLNKLYGSWRIAGHRHIDTYNKIEFTKKGDYFFERISNDTCVDIFSAKFTLDAKNNLIILNKNGAIKKLKALKLTETCFEYEDLDVRRTSFNTRINQK